MLKPDKAIISQIKIEIYLVGGGGGGKEKGTASSLEAILSRMTLKPNLAPVRYLMCIKKKKNRTTKVYIYTRTTVSPKTNIKPILVKPY